MACSQLAIKKKSLQLLLRKYGGRRYEIVPAYVGIYISSIKEIVKEIKGYYKEHGIKTFSPSHTQIHAHMHLFSKSQLLRCFNYRNNRND